jgi:reactive intermediate/imine deaminase
MKQKIQTELAPQAIGPYSQAICIGNTVYLSGQIPLNPQTMELIANDFQQQVFQTLTNLEQVTKAAGGSLDQVVKLTVYLVDLAQFPIFNQLMSQFFTEPYPARTTLQVSALPKGAQVEVDAIMFIE